LQANLAAFALVENCHWNVDMSSGIIAKLWKQICRKVDFNYYVWIKFQDWGCVELRDTDILSKEFCW